MKKYQFLRKYFNDLLAKIVPDEIMLGNLVTIADLLIEVNQNGKKCLIFGNGGSAAMASHVSVDLTKNARIRCMNFNEADLITCFSNDYGYDRWVEKAVEFYADDGDLTIFISSSGKSRNMLNGVKAAKKLKLKSVITLTGFESDNPLRNSGDINLWVDSKAYNYVENTHQIWLLGIVDLIIGNKEYPA
tara:strand:- start:426 stop:992 length:567 start_codon:yes stop_codon:yes gene_type:complete